MAKALREEYSSGEIDRLSDSIYDLGIKIGHLTSTQQHMSDSVDKIRQQVSIINDRNLRQDTILSLLFKLWKLSPYVLGIVFLITLSFTDSSFNISKWAENKIENALEIKK